jgi:hypothetical protein
MSRATTAAAAAAVAAVASAHFWRSPTIMASEMPKPFVLRKFSIGTGATFSPPAPMISSLYPKARQRRRRWLSLSLSLSLSRSLSRSLSLSLSLSLRELGPLPCAQGKSQETKETYGP